MRGRIALVPPCLPRRFSQLSARARGAFAGGSADPTRLHVYPTLSAPQPTPNRCPPGPFPGSRASAALQGPHLRIRMAQRAAEGYAQKARQRRSPPARSRTLPGGTARSDPRFERSCLRPAGGRDRRRPVSLPALTGSRRGGACATARMLPNREKRLRGSGSGDSCAMVSLQSGAAV